MALHFGRSSETNDHPSISESMDFTKAYAWTAPEQRVPRTSARRELDFDRGTTDDTWSSDGHTNMSVEGAYQEQGTQFR